MHWPTEIALGWHHNEGNGISNHQPHDCLLNRLLGRRSKKTSKLHVTGLCVGNSLVTSEFPAQMASNAENASFWWCHHEDTISPMLAPYQTDGHSPTWSWHQIRWSHSANFMLGPHTAVSCLKQWIDQTWYEICQSTSADTHIHYSSYYFGPLQLTYRAISSNQESSSEN